MCELKVLNGAPPACKCIPRDLCGVWPVGSAIYYHASRNLSPSFILTVTSVIVRVLHYHTALSLAIIDHHNSLVSRLASLATAVTPVPTFACVPVLPQAESSSLALHSGSPSSLLYAPLLRRCFYARVACGTSLARSTSSSPCTRASSTSPAHHGWRAQSPATQSRAPPRPRPRSRHSAAAPRGNGRRGCRPRSPRRWRRWYRCASSRPVARARERERMETWEVSGRREERRAVSEEIYRRVVGNL